MQGDEHMSFPHKRINWDSVRGSVRISSKWSELGTWPICKAFWNTFSRMRCKCNSVCLDLEWKGVSKTETNIINPKNRSLWTGYTQFIQQHLQPCNLNTCISSTTVLYFCRGSWHRMLLLGSQWNKTFPPKNTKPSRRVSVIQIRCPISIWKRHNIKIRWFW